MQLARTYEFGKFTETVSALLWYRCFVCLCISHDSTMTTMVCIAYPEMCVCVLIHIAWVELKKSHCVFEMMLSDAKYIHWMRLSSSLWYGSFGICGIAILFLYSLFTVRLYFHLPLSCSLRLFNACHFLSHFLDFFFDILAYYRYYCYLFFFLCFVFSLCLIVFILYLIRFFRTIRSAN